MSDAEIVAKYCREYLDLHSASLPEEYGYRHVPLCIIDSVWSIGVRHEGVQNVVARYAEHVGIRLARVACVPLHPPLPEAEHTISELVRLLQPRKR